MCRCDDAEGKQKKKSSCSLFIIVVQLTTHEHDADGEDLLRVRVGAYVAETDAGEAAESEVEGGDVSAGHGGPTHGAVDVGCLQTLPQLLQPAWWMRSVNGCVRFVSNFQVAHCLQKTFI